jgi:hypothetical protein
VGGPATNSSRDSLLRLVKFRANQRRKELRRLVGNDVIPRKIWMPIAKLARQISEVSVETIVEHDNRRFFALR